MVPIILAIVPVFLLICLGFGLRARAVLAEGFWGPAERLTCFILFPALLVTTLGGADLAGLDAGGMAGAVGAAVCLRLVALPMITALARWMFGVSGIAAFVAVLFNGTPSAPTSYILARQLGGDARLMASSITGQTGLALITLPAALTFLV